MHGGRGGTPYSSAQGYNGVRGGYPENNRYEKKIEEGEGESLIGATEL